MSDGARQGRFSILERIERVGNRLPDPITLFIIATVLVMGLSHLGDVLDWQVTERRPVPVTEPVKDEQGEPVLDPDTGKPKQKPVIDPATGEPRLEWDVVREQREQFVTRIVRDEAGEPVLDEHTGEPKSEVVRDADGEPKVRMVELDEPRIHAVRSLLTADGIFWALSHMVENFVTFPPLGIVLVGMLGIGVAERTGLIGALLKGFMLIVPGRLLTPAVFFIGVMSSLGTDAGYVVLPPLAAALYLAMGRSPLAGIAAVFAGVSAGFNANLFITGLDPMLASLSTQGAAVIDPDYAVNPASNWWFLIASTVVITLTGWFVTARYVERRLEGKPPEEGGPPRAATDQFTGQGETNSLGRDERRGLTAAGAAMVLTLAGFLAMILVPGMPLHGRGPVFDRWVEAIVPMLFFIFIIPGIVYGVVLGHLRNDRDVAKLMIDAMAAMAPIIVLAFVAAQFINHFSYSGLDRVLATAGGQWLGQLEAGPALLIVAFILVTLVFNLFMGSMSAKYALFAPIFVPMFMLVGISPELTQAAYRIGDSVSNIITPLNAYLIIILMVMRQYIPGAGIGTLIATMFPYTLVFTVVWTLLLLVWMALGLPLGVDGQLWYDVAAAAP